MKAVKIYTLVVLTLLGINVIGQEKINETNIKVFGNCNMCQERIEGALDIEEVKFAKWDKKSKNLKIAYSDAISLDSLKQRIAAVGHDTEDVTAPDSVYAKLPMCCMFRDNPKTH
ncbi:MAG: hypothetical protein JW995_07300 [Melioribacteraceae bacterium]|nr:hypothetical protein [Melioribacteraceae bacterium]